MLLDFFRREQYVGTIHYSLFVWSESQQPTSSFKFIKSNSAASVPLALNCKSLEKYKLTVNCKLTQNCILTAYY